MLDPIHPFPARMAPEIAFEFLQELKQGAVVLDPMCGSGVALRLAVEKGYHPIGNDADPLAVLMSRIWISPQKHSTLVEHAEIIVQRSRRYSNLDVPWQQDDETTPFVRFWFAKRQRDDLSRLSLAISGMRESLPAYIVRALQLALSRLIVTKTRGASLAWDVAHSRPHRKKTAATNDFEVIPEFLKSCRVLARKLAENNSEWIGTVKRGDARRLRLRDHSVDAVITSPPYLNAIDYLRGHRLSLVWLGYSLADLHSVRSDAIGTERARHRRITMGNTGRTSQPDRRTLHLIDQYVHDIGALMRELKRVTRRRGRISIVTANSNIRGYEVRTNSLVQAAAAGAGLRLVDERIRLIEKSKRYLPVQTKNSALKSRMMEEHIQYFVA